MLSADETRILQAYHNLVDNHVTIVSRSEQKLLFQQMLYGDVAAEQTLWLQGVKMVIKLVNKFVSLGRIDPGDTLDAIQEGNLAIGEKLDKWDPQRGAYSTFMWNVVRNALVDFAREEEKGGLTGVGDGDIPGHTGLDSPVDDEDEDPEYKALDSVISHHLDVDLVALMLDYDRVLDGRVKVVMDLWVFEDLTIPQMAERVGVAVGTIRADIQRGVHKLITAYNKSF